MIDWKKLIDFYKICFKNCKFKTTIIHTNRFPGKFSRRTPNVLPISKKYVLVILYFNSEVIEWNFIIVYKQFP